MNEQPTLVSIVTPCFNAENSIERTMVSVFAQTYKNIEYIVMDGGSTDATITIVERYGERLTLVSEADSGQTNAINKGWQRATGEVIAWLNADDQYLPDTVQKAVQFLDENPHVGWVYGNPISIANDGKSFPFRRHSIAWDYDQLLSLGCYVSQPTVFLRRSILNDFGLLDEALVFAMDYEFWLRIGREYPGHFLPELKALVVRSRQTKTQSGGMDRIAELSHILTRYGSDRIPVYVRHQWAAAYVASFAQHLLKAELRKAGQDLRTLSRYPLVVPWGIVKLIVRRFLTEDIEARLRRLVLQRHR